MGMPAAPRVALISKMATQLVPLQDVERLSSSVIRVLGGNPGKFTLQGSNTYIIGTGKQRLLIDTGEGKPAWIASLKEILQQENATVAKAIITHWHHDHQGSIKHLLEYSPSTSVYKNQPETGQLDIKDGQFFHPVIPKITWRWFSKKKMPCSLVTTCLVMEQ